MCYFQNVYHTRQEQGHRILVPKKSFRRKASIATVSELLIFPRYSNPASPEIYKIPRYPQDNYIVLQNKKSFKRNANPGKLRPLDFTKTHEYRLFSLDMDCRDLRGSFNLGTTLNKGINKLL